MAKWKRMKNDERKSFSLIFCADDRPFKPIYSSNKRWMMNPSILGALNKVSVLTTEYDDCSTKTYPTKLRVCLSIFFSLVRGWFPRDNPCPLFLVDEQIKYYLPLFSIINIAVQWKNAFSLGISRNDFEISKDK